MMTYQHNENLKFDYPDSWTSQYEDGIILICDPEEGFGALQTTVFFPPAGEPVSLKSWLAEQLDKYHERYTIEEFENYARSEYIQEDGRSWKYWAIRKDNMVLFITYNCEVEDEGREDIIVDSIVQSVWAI